MAHGSIDTEDMKSSFKHLSLLSSRLLSAFIWVISLSIATALLFSYTLPQDLSKTSILYATLVEASFFVRVLTFHLGLVLLVLMGAALLMRRWKLSIFIGPVMLFCMYPTLSAMIPHHPAAAVGPTLRIMSMNLKYTVENGELITHQLTTFNPDVVVIEDSTPYSKQVIEKQFGGDYPHRGFLFNALQGLAIYSRIPFEGGRPTSTFTKLRRQMRVVINFNGKQLAIYVEHPFSPRSRQRILNNRLATLDLVEQMRNEQLPVVLAGDFNFTQSTPNEDSLKTVGMRDGFELAGQGRGSTWPVEPQWMQWLPGVRIDHVFISPQLTCTQFLVGDYDGSDHLPIVADVGFTK